MLEKNFFIFFLFINIIQPMPIRYRKDGEPDKRQETSMNNLKKSSLYQALQEKKEREREKKVVEETPVDNIKKEEPVEVKKEEPVEIKKEEPKKNEPEPVEEVEDEDDDDDDEYEIQVRKPAPPPPKKEEKPKKKKKKVIIEEDEDDADDEEEVKVVSRKKYDKELTSLKLKNEELKNSLLYGAHLNRLSHVASRQVKLQF